MIELDADCTRRGGVTCVRVSVRNERSTPQRVELESALDGPVWAPHSGPLSVSEWSDSGWAGVVPAGRTRGVGFATSAPPAEELVEIVSVERADERWRDGDHVIDELEAPSPPSTVVGLDR